MTELTECTHVPEDALATADAAVCVRWSRLTEVTDRGDGGSAADRAEDDGVHDDGVHT